MNGDPRFMDNAEVEESQTEDQTSTSAAASTPEAATFDARKLVTITCFMVDKNLYVKGHRLALQAL